MQVVALGYLGIQATDPQAWAEFGPGVLGLSLGDTGDDGTLFLRMDERAYRLAIHPGPRDGLACFGWELPTPSALEQAYRELDAAGCSPRRGTPDECRARKVQGLVYVSDPGGFQLELFYGQLTLYDQFLPARPISGFVAGELGLGHAVIGVPDYAAAQTFYSQVMGFRISDTFANRIMFFHVNPRHHSLGLVNTGTASLRHIMLEVRDLDDVGRTYDLCLSKGYVTRGLGRHPNDKMLSFYLASPGSFDIEYGWGGRLVDDATWSVQELGVTSVWGHQPVGEASSTLLTPVQAR
jgi:2,3-dihydroxybiphenyl 1,2-dioxygenase